MLRRTAPVVVVATVLLGMGGCSSDSDSSGGEGPASLGHVHGVGVDPADGALHIASHGGVFRVSDDGTLTLIADRRQDTMGFTVIGPGHFLGSGHPDPDEDLPGSLGLLESTDGAETWDSLSLMGEADFHALEGVGDRVYGYDSHSGSLMTTTDRVTWQTISRQPVFDLAADPAEPDTVYATTGQGELVVSVDGAELEPVGGAPVLTSIDWQADGPLVGVGVDGTVMVSDDTRSWREVGRLGGPAVALEVVAGSWYAATQSGVHTSTDDGATWSLLVPADHN
ncbi:F510_1955 family glycosylhydrolase [Nocardioides sp.]|uniref:F510_1955 family glycosylhydrolase n=1 Tax=Nocardioides sp. TaxID=35761 RepID=UPI003569864C